MELRGVASQPPSIRGRLVKSLLWISITFGLLTSVVVWYVIAHEMGELMDQELREAAEIFHSVMAVQPDLATDGQSATHHFGYEEHLVWQVVDASSGRVRSRSHKAPEQALQRAPTEAVAWTQDGQWRAFTSVFSQRPELFLVVAQSRNQDVADLIGIHSGDFLVTEAGFGADIGLEKFVNIKCRASGLQPDAAVVVTTVRAMKAHSGRYRIAAGQALPEGLLEESTADVMAGADNLRRQVQNVRAHGITPVIAINAFPGRLSACDALGSNCRIDATSPR